MSGSATVDDIRQMTVSHLESHRDSYIEFLCYPFASNDPNHTDTEPADEKDVQIAQIETPVDRSRAYWNKYLQRLRNGGWGDHLCVAAMANMFSVTINVFTATAHGCTVNAATPVDDNSICDGICENRPLRANAILQYEPK